MSTRSMTVIRESRTGHPVYLYRHCDGYPACALASLLEACGDDGAFRTATGAAMELLNSNDARYELAFYPPEDQGDLEHVYTATLRPDGFVRGWDFTHSARLSLSWGEGGSDWRVWDKSKGDWKTMRELANRARAAMNGRIKAMRAKSGQPVADDDLFDMLPECHRAPKPATV